MLIMIIVLEPLHVIVAYKDRFPILAEVIQQMYFILGVGSFRMTTSTRSVFVWLSPHHEITKSPKTLVRHQFLWMFRSATSKTNIS